MARAPTDAPVRPRGVDVTDARRVRRIEHLVTPSFHINDGAIGSEIILPSESDVRWPAKCGQTETDAAHREAGDTERNYRYGNGQHHCDFVSRRVM